MSVVKLDPFPKALRLRGENSTKMFELPPFDHPNGDHLTPERFTQNTHEGHWEEPVATT